MKILTSPYISINENINICSIGKIIEESGSNAAVESLNWAKEYPYKPITFVNTAHSNGSFFIRFNVHGSMLKAVYDKDLSPVNEDSCVEFYCKLPDTDFYTCFEFNCIGTCNAYRRYEKTGESVSFTQEELTEIKRFSSLGRRIFNEMEGMFEWDLTITIPLALMNCPSNEFPQTLFANFNKCADQTDSKHYISWNPIKSSTPDFHHPDFFGKIILQ